MNTVITNKLAKFFDQQPVEKAWVFGSYARSEENAKSDIDILVRFVSGASITLFKYAGMVSKLEKITKHKVDLVEEGFLKDFAKETAELDKQLIYERKTER